MTKMICDKCLAIIYYEGYKKDPPERPSRAVHHSCYADLESSDKNGCKICSFLRQVLSKDRPDHLFSSFRVDEANQKRLDQVLGQPFVVEFVWADIDNNLAPCCYGLQGIKYFRFNEREIYHLPYVDVSSLPDSIPLDGRSWHMTGRQLGPKMDFSLAKSWLNECAEKHESCSAAINTPLPSRILDLAAPGETRHVRLKVDNAGVFERYATLSHCWGESQPLKLTQSTYEGFRKEISFESLPRTFQDAVTAARSLGLKYLWIDSLCIVQDSKEDWEEQCTAMRQIYKYSFVTLAAPEASDCNAGFLHSRPPPLKVDFQLSDGASVVLSHHGCADYPYDKQSNREDYRLINKRDYRSLTEQNSPLFKRAWILQERLLSSRVLYLSPSRIYLECFTNNRYEDCHYPTPGPDKLLSKNVTKWKSEQLGDERQRFAHWEHLVVRYSNMNLTYGTDRLPALSGLVSEFHRVTKATYLAGHWLEDLNLGWFVVSQGQSKAALSGSEYVAPSWSWASSNGPIEFYRPWDFPKDMVFYHGLEINQAVCSTGIDPFGIVKSGYLDITGILKKGVSARRSPDRRYFQVITSCYTMERMGCSRGESFGMYYPDNPSTVLEPESKLLLLFLGRFQYTRFVLCDRVIAIAVEPIDGEEEYTYRRIGLVITRGFRVEQGFHEHFFADIKPTILRLI